MAVVSKNPSGRSTVNSPNDYGGKLVPCKVKQIILDPNSELAQTFGGFDAVGVVFFNKVGTDRPMGGSNPNEKEKPWNDQYDGWALPMFPHIKYYPLINEVVSVVTTTSKDYLDDKLQVQNYYFPPINVWNHPHHNTLPAPQNYLNLKEKGQFQNQIEDYELTGLIRRPSTGSINIGIPLGNYFREQLKIKPLLPYEGDYITEGRFGNSIRLGATARGIAQDEQGLDKYVFPTGSFDTRNPWSLGGSTQNGDPITIIRNGQNITLELEEDEDDFTPEDGYSGSQGWVHTTEDINHDPSSIYMTSTQNIANFQVAAPMCWYSFGLSAIVKQDKNKEAEKIVKKPDTIIDEREIGEEGGEGNGSGGGPNLTSDSKTEVYRDKGTSPNKYRYTKLPDDTYWYKVGEDGEWIQQTSPGGIVSIDERINSDGVIQLNDESIININPNFEFPEINTENITSIPLTPFGGINNTINEETAFPELSQNITQGLGSPSFQRDGWSFYFEPFAPLNNTSMTEYRPLAINNATGEQKRGYNVATPNDSVLRMLEAELFGSNDVEYNLPIAALKDQEFEGTSISVNHEIAKTEAKSNALANILEAAGISEFNFVQTGNNKNIEEVFSKNKEKQITTEGIITYKITRVFKII